MNQLSWSLKLTTPLGPDALSLQSFSGTEAISEPFHFILTASMGGAWIDPAQLVGQSVAVTLKGGDGIARPFHGLVTRLTQSHSTATLELRPWLWRLTLSRNSRIFQNQSVPDILTAVFADYPDAATRQDLVLGYDPIEYCVQYDESDFDFVSRLMEAAGIAYFFAHGEAVHTMVLVDDPAKFPDCANAATVPWLSLAPGNAWLSDARIENVAHRQSLVPDGFKTADYNFVTPATALLATEGGGKVYEYPGDFTLADQATAVAKRRAEELAAPAALVEGGSPLRHLAAGTAVTLTGHPADALNAKHVLLSVTHRAGKREYENEFTAFPAAVPFRPPRLTPRPRIAGAQTAIVVGPAGKEIWTDEYGRIKVQFHWDRLGQKDENSSCWVRVAQSWAGTSWGAFTLPRIGQEVVVSFLEGDPDRPLVTGCVYNGDNPVPYALPDNMTRTTLKSRSSPQAEGFNEIRFEDKADSEEIFVQAQKDLNVTVLNTMTETVTKDHAVTVKEGNATFTVSQGNWTTKIDTGDAEQTIAGKLTVTVTGDVTIKSSGNVTVEAGTGLTLKGGTTVAIEAGTGLTLKGATVELTASGKGAFDGGGMLELKGGMVKLN